MHGVAVAPPLFSAGTPSQPQACQVNIKDLALFALVDVADVNDVEATRHISLARDMHARKLRQG